MTTAIVFVYSVGVIILLLFGSRWLDLSPTEDAWLLGVVAALWPALFCMALIGFPMFYIGKAIRWLITNMAELGEWISNKIERYV